MKKIIKNWRDERGYTFQHIADLTASSVGHIQNIFYERVGAGEELAEKFRRVDALLHLIDGKPADLVLLRYELSELTGISMEDMEKVEKKADRRLTNGTVENFNHKSPEAPTIKKKNLRLCTLKSLERIRENGYESVCRKGVFFDKAEIDGEIARKIRNKQFKGFKFAERQEKREKMRQITN
ncbi:MAG: hypothetical protein CL529_11980 [Aequorivita sp.]|mgnify:CR=1 FL=1|nr:hypothetical protein [Aequorivita sp.]|tara:strand:+ start:29977 stop:30522 length:546 start_codon:yes stop_codon:yes gene_type:complete